MKASKARYRFPGPPAPAPKCDCHGEPMRWNKQPSLRLGGTWKCVVRLKAYERKGRLKKYGLSEEDYERLLAEQGGVCAICEEPPSGRWKRLAVDHDHETGEVRGLLCITCNTLLGRLEARWDATMDYLKKPR